MSDIDELRQLISGPHEARDEALLDVLNTLANSPATHLPQPTPALAAFLRHPSPAHTTIAAQRTWTARLLRPPSAGRLRFGPAVLTGWLTPVLFGTATAVAATAALITLAPHSSPPAAPASPSVSTHPSPSRTATPAGSHPTPDPSSASAPSTAHDTGVPALAPTTHAGSSLIRIAPSATAPAGPDRRDRPTRNSTKPSPHKGDNDAGTDHGDDKGDHDDQGDHEDQDAEAPRTDESHGRGSKAPATHDADGQNHGNSAGNGNSDETGDRDDHVKRRDARLSFSMIPSAGAPTVP
jgi:hypothetical protein